MKHLRQKGKRFFLIGFFGLIFRMMTCLAFAEGIIADHTAVQQFDLIPDEWIESAKQLTIHYGHTSHGSQITSGLLLLEEIDPKYSIAIRKSASSAELPPQENPIALLIYDGNPPETYISPNDYWDGESALNRTRAVAGTGLFSFSMWSWCGQQSSNSEEAVQRYLNALNTLDSEYPAMKFIYMTGHTNGGSETLARNNQMVRDYVITNNKVLFDFSDIESWDPDGNYYPDTTDACEWCATWCNDHPEDCGFTCSCAHSHKYNCLVKAKAFWWMMARLAGWDPSGGTNYPPTASASASPTDGVVPLSVSFSGSGNDSDGTIVSYSWDFGDNSISSIQNPTHVYESAGSFTAILIVTDDDGATATASVPILGQSASVPPDPPTEITVSILSP